MTHAEKILAEALHLSDEDRADVARRILESLGAPNPHAHLSDEALEDELERRIEDVESGRVQTLSLDEVRQRAFGPTRK